LGGPHAPASAIKKVKRREHKQAPTKVLKKVKRWAKAKKRAKAVEAAEMQLAEAFFAKELAVEAAEMQLAEAFFAKELRTNENDGYASDSSGYMSLTD
jgi:hypothetical protein